MKKRQTKPIPQKDHILDWTEQEQIEFNAMLTHIRMSKNSMLHPTPKQIAMYCATMDRLDDFYTNALCTTKNV